MKGRNTGTKSWPFAITLPKMDGNVRSEDHSTFNYGFRKLVVVGSGKEISSAFFLFTKPFLANGQCSSHFLLTNDQLHNVSKANWYYIMIPVTLRLEN